MTIEIMRGILRECHRVTGVDPDRVRGKSRLGPVVKARQACVFAMASRSKWSIPRIGTYFHRDHSTIIHSVEAAIKRGDADPAYRKLLDALMEAPLVGILEPIALPEPEPEPEPDPPVFVIEDEPLPDFQWDANGSWWEENRVVLDEDGETEYDRHAIRRIIAGSKRLAETINLARAA